MRRGVDWLVPRHGGEKQQTAAVMLMVMVMVRKFVVDIVRGRGRGSDGGRPRRFGRQRYCGG